MWGDDLPSLSTVGIGILKKEIEKPASFDARYKEDFDIIKAHKYILLKLEERVKSNRIDEEIKELEKSLQKRQTLVQKKNTYIKIEKLKKEKVYLSTLIQDYIKDVEEYVEKYRKIGSINRVITFSSEKQQDKENEEEKDYRKRLIFNYLRAAERYYKINAVWEGDEVKCPGCGTDLPQEVADEFSSPCCEVCGVERKIFAKVPFSCDGVCDNTNRNNYEEEENFRKTVDRYQGKIMIKNLTHLLQDLDTFFVSCNMKIGEEIKKLPLNNKGRRPGTNKDLMAKALKEKGYPHHYKNMNLICYHYWGWTLPDLYDIEEGLFEDYKAFIRVYADLKKGRKSCLNAEYILLVLLLKRGRYCEPDDFKIVRTDEIFDEYEEIRIEIFTRLGWPTITLP